MIFSSRLHAKHHKTADYPDLFPAQKTKGRQTIENDLKPHLFRTLGRFFGMSIGETLNFPFWDNLQHRACRSAPG